MPSHRKERPIVALVTPFSSSEDNRPAARNAFARLKNNARRILNLLHWTLGRRWKFHYSTYEDRQNCNRGDIAIRLASRWLLEEAFDRSVEIVEFGWDRFCVSSLKDLRIDLVVIAGGGYFFLDTHGDFPPRLQAHLQALGTLKCPAVGLCLGVNRLVGDRTGASPVPSERAKDVVLQFAERLAMLSVRDAKALEMMETIRPGIAAKLPDPALFLPVDETAKAPSRRTNDELWVGVNLAFHGKEVTSLIAEQFPIVVGALRQLKGEKNCRFFYFVHYDSERILPSLFELAGLPMTVVDCPPPAMLAWYRELDIHIAGMLHSAILATSVDVPSIHIAYDVKGIGFFESMGMQHNIAPARGLNAEQFQRQVTRLIAGRHDERRDISRRKSALWRDLQNFVGRIPPLLD